MRVLLVHSSDLGRGGGNIVMQRLYRGLNGAGIDAKILSKLKRLDSSDSIALPAGYWLNTVERQLRRVTSRLGLNDIHCLSTFGVRRLQAYRDADVLDLHCIHGGFFNYLALPRLTENKPAVISLHDMWPLTGHCSHSFDCERWKIGCGRCPYLGTHPFILRDGTKVEWQLKRWVYNHSNLTIVAQSQWLADLAKQSLLNRFPIHHIPNGVDTDVYRPHDPLQCRSLLGIPPRSKVLLFVTANLDDRAKGGDLLVQALQALPPSLKAETVLLLIGDRGESLADRVGIRTLNLGYVASDHLKAIAYSAADLFLHPTRADNLPLVLIESMACGTPSVSFRVGGVPEAVRPGITGYLAEPEQAKDFSNRVVQLLENNAFRGSMKQQCREIALKEYPFELQIQRYIGLYRRVLKENGKGKSV